MTRADQMLADASHRVSRAAALLGQFGIQGQRIPDCPVGCGFGVHSSHGYSLVSAMAGDNAVNVTVGVVKNLRHERAAILDECNSRIRNSGYPWFLHEADAGWDVLLQARFPAYVIEPAGDYFAGLVNGLPQLAAGAATALNQIAGGAPYDWTAADMSRLLVRSLL